MRTRLGVLVSGRGSNLQSLIDAAAGPAFPAEIALVISNRPGAYALTRAEQAGIPALTIDHKVYGDRESFDAALHQALVAARIDLVCLAGFMRLLTPGFVASWHNRMLNIHPSLLPAFPGLHTHERAIAAGVRLTGCSVHLVRPEMDTGPMLVQRAVPVLPDDTPDSLGARVLAEEHLAYPLAVRLMAEGRVGLDGDRVTRLDWPEIAL